MSGKTLTIEQILTLLAETPPRLAALTAGLTETQLHTPPAEGEWSANDVLAHLRACGDIWGDHIRAILTEDNPTRRAMNPTTWIKHTDYLELEFQPSLRAFTAQRTELLERLKLLTEEQWHRTATLVGAGKPLQRTVLSYANGMAIHERPHIKQIERMVTKMPKP